MTKSWKTSLVGIMLGLIPIWQQVLFSLRDHKTVDWEQVAVGAGIIILGLVAKDYDVTGGVQ
jgi:hypothetical protein